MPAVGKVVCVGRNYAAHARELGNPVPQAPIFFIKPGSSVVSMAPVIYLPALGKNSVGYECHYECELALLIGKPLKRAKPASVTDAIQAVGLGLDLTVRALQADLKAQGHPWERAKAFDGACPLSDWVDITFKDWQAIYFDFSINGEEKQHGLVSQMLIGIEELVSEMSHWFTLEVGDVVLTGTPAGVGPLVVGDQYKATLGVHKGTVLEVSGRVANAHP